MNRTPFLPPPLKQTRGIYLPPPLLDRSKDIITVPAWLAALADPAGAIRVAVAVASALRDRARNATPCGTTRSKNAVSDTPNRSQRARNNLVGRKARADRPRNF
jgi:hypothetical protein